MIIEWVEEEFICLIGYLQLFGYIFEECSV